MKKNTLFRLITSCVFLCAVFSASVSAAPYGDKGKIVNWVQPSGEKLTLRIFGDDYFARTETASGHTVVYNSSTGAYHYAKLSADGKTLLPSPVMAHLAPAGGIKKGVALSADRAREISNVNRNRFNGHRIAKWDQRVKAFRAGRAAAAARAGSRSAPPYEPEEPIVGDYVGLTIIVQFPDDPRTQSRDAVTFPTSRAKVVDYCNQKGYNADGNAGSIRDYFYDQSAGKLDYTQKVTPLTTLPRPRNYYNFSDYPTNRELRDAGLAGRLMLTDAIGVLRGQNFDFSGLTTDADGNIMATNVFFAGSDSGVWAQGLWPHQWTLGAPVQVGTPGNPESVYAYQITNIEDAAPTVGTFCHENGHLLLNYPDLYVYVGIGEGVGAHCLMGSGNHLDEGRTPAPLNLFFKEVVGWTTITDLQISEYSTRILPATGNIGYRFRKFSQSPEYFVVENRGTGDKWAKHALDKGILVWHVDESIERGNAFPIPNYGVALEQADGRNDLEAGRNRGDGSDAFDLGSPVFSRASLPNSDWLDGSPSNVRVQVLDNPQRNVRVTFGELPPNTIIVSKPSGGEIGYRGADFRIQWEANVIGNLKLELLQDGDFVTTITPNTANDGLFVWKIPQNFKAGTGFSILASTLANPVAVSDTSEGTFSISDSTFPVAGKIPDGWRKPSDVDTRWAVTTSRRLEGRHAIQNTHTKDGGSSGIQYSSSFKAGKISFYLKTSTEFSFDKARFFINGNEQSLGDESGQRGVSGEVEWTFYSFDVPAGRHTFKWTYEKDDSLSSGEDSVWLDAVELPPGTQEIQVAGPGGGSLSSGVTAITMPSVRKGESSVARTITITNSGRADLNGIRVFSSGSNASSFVADRLGKSVLKRGQSTTFKIVFKPKSRGMQSAQIRIASNDEDERPFIIPVSGMGLGIPRFTVSHPEDNALKDGKSVVKFGFENVRRGEKTKTFTIRNTGSVRVSDLLIEKEGMDREDFKIREPIQTSLEPGEFVTFEVTFAPQSKDLRTATILVSSSYKKGGKFKFDVKGVGVPRSVTSKSAITSSLPGDSRSEALPNGSTGSVSIDGKSYRTIAIDRSRVPSGLRPVVEVSDNLVDWFSGDQHTTVMTSDRSILIVRDNTPREPGVKRHIRVRFVRR